MSKSKGNVYFTDTLLDRGWTAAEARFFLIYGHYRETLDFSWDAMEDAAARLRDFRGRVNAIMKKARKRDHDNGDASHELEKIFRHGMDNDLNVRIAFDKIDNFLSQRRAEELSPFEASAIAACLRRIDSVLNVIYH